MKKLIVMRGWPGSGKSYRARQLRSEYESQGLNVEIFSTDDLFYVEGEYLFDFRKLGSNHTKNLNLACQAMNNGVNVIIIDNTNIKYKDFKAYIKDGIIFGYDIILAEGDSPWKDDIWTCYENNSHSVPIDVIMRMKNEYQSNEDVISNINEKYPSVKISIC